MGLTAKTIKGKKYLYHWHYKNGKKYEVYCGLESDDDNKRTAYGLELLLLEDERKKLNMRIAELENYSR